MMLLQHLHHLFHGWRRNPGLHEKYLLLSVFPEDFEVKVDALRELFGEEVKGDAEEWLESLADKSLLEIRGKEVWLHNLQHVFLRKKGFVWIFQVMRSRESGKRIVGCCCGSHHYDAMRIISSDASTKPQEMPGYAEEVRKGGSRCCEADGWALEYASESLKSNRELS